MKSKIPLMVPLIESSKSGGTDESGTFDAGVDPGDELLLLLASCSPFCPFPA